MRDQKASFTFLFRKLEGKQAVMIRGGHDCTCEDDGEQTTGGGGDSGAPMGP